MEKDSESADLYLKALFCLLSLSKNIFSGLEK